MTLRESSESDLLFHSPAPVTDERSRSRSTGKPVQIEWSVSAAMAFDRMRHHRRRLLAVIDGDRVIGRVYRRDLDDLGQRGTWLGSVLVRDVMRRAA
jgi:hypothetical protein